MQLELPSCSLGELKLQNIATVVLVASERVEKHLTACLHPSLGNRSRIVLLYSSTRWLSGLIKELGMNLSGTASRSGGCGYCMDDSMLSIS